jgi:hypothetical protein
MVLKLVPFVDQTDARSGAAEKSRGDWTAIELFLAGVQTLQSAIR